VCLLRGTSLILKYSSGKFSSLRESIGAVTHILRFLKTNVLFFSEDDFNDFSIVDVYDYNNS
jgi:hypothetical protein